MCLLFGKFLIKMCFLFFLNFLKTICTFYWFIWFVFGMAQLSVLFFKFFLETFLQKFMEPATRSTYDMNPRTRLSFASNSRFSCTWCFRLSLTWKNFSRYMDADANVALASNALRFDTCVCSLFIRDKT